MANKKTELGYRLGDFLLRHRLLVVAIALLFVFAWGIGLKDFYFVANYRYFFGEDNPQRLEFEKLQKVYSKNDAVIILVAPENKQVGAPPENKGLSADQEQ